MGEWKKRTREILSNAVFLVNNESSLEHSSDGLVQKYRVWGTDFFHPVQGANPYLDQIPAGTNILLAHNPPRGCGDGGERGCECLLSHVERVKPRLLVSGH